MIAMARTKIKTEIRDKKKDNEKTMRVGKFSW